MIIWCGGEDIDFRGGANAPYWNTTTSYRRTDYSRCSLRGNNTYCISNPLTLMSGITEFWMSAQVYFPSGITVSYDALVFGIFDISNTDTASGFGFRKTLGQMVLRKRNAGTWTTLATESGTSLGYSNVKKIDLHIKYAEDGLFRGYLDGNLLAQYSGDTRISGVTGFNYVFIYGSALAGDVQISEIIVADEDTRAFNCSTIVPNASGDTNQWTGTYEDIDDIEASSGDLIYHDTPDEIFTSNLSDIVPAGEWSIKGIKMASRLNLTMMEDIPLGVQIGIKTNNQLNFGSTIEPTSSYQTVEAIYNNNPITSTEFTLEETDDLQCAAKIIDVT